MKNVRLAPPKLPLGSQNAWRWHQARNWGLLSSAGRRLEQASRSPHYRHFSLSQILPVWQGETPRAARPCDPRAAEAVERPAATLSRVIDPIDRSSPTTKSAKNTRRGTWERTAFTRKVIAPVCPTASLSLGSLRSLWLSCSGTEILASWHLCALALMQLPFFSLNRALRRNLASSRETKACVLASRSRKRCSTRASSCLRCLRRKGQCQGRAGTARGPN
jgi:hypothetical protein